MELALRGILAVVLLGLSSGSTHATSLIFQYTGVIYSVGLFDGAAEIPGISYGSVISGSFIFDSNCSDNDPSGTRAFYPNCIRRMQFDGMHSTPPTTSYSYFLVDADPTHNVVGSYLNDIDGTTSDVYSFMLEAVPAVFADDSPDWSSLTLEDFASDGSQFFFQRSIYPGDPHAYQGGPVAVTQYYARFSDLRIRPAPEPGTLVLLGLGLLGMGVSRLRNG